MMDGYKLLFGDLHTHFQEPEGADTILDSARENIDFCAVLCYPFSWEVKNGLRVETVRQRPEFLQWWEGLRGLARDYHRPGEFVTFLGFEWHGNRRRYGDHNVIYCDDGLLDDAWSLPELYANLRERRAFVLPHHTGYCPGWRSKDWDVYDEALSPVMEVFSQHGSSEGCNTPFPMERNASMGPRACGSYVPGRPRPRPSNRRHRFQRWGWFARPLGWGTGSRLGAGLHPGGDLGGHSISPHLCRNGRSNRAGLPRCRRGDGFGHVGRENGGGGGRRRRVTRH